MGFICLLTQFFDVKIKEYKPGSTAEMRIKMPESKSYLLALDLVDDGKIDFSKETQYGPRFKGTSTELSAYVNPDSLNKVYFSVVRDAKAKFDLEHPMMH